MTARTTPSFAFSMFTNVHPTRSTTARRAVRNAAVCGLLLMASSLSGAAQAHPLHAEARLDAPNADSPVASADVSTSEGQAPWAPVEDWIVDALTHGNVLHLEPIGHGITNPFRAEIHHQGRRLHAVWKPIVNADYVEHESYRAEIAAYRLSRALDLDMVPPTVERKIGHRWGSLQFWVDGYELFAEAVSQRPIDASIIPRLEAMRFFDALIDNPDRHAGNYMVNDQWHVVLIDHSRAFDGGSRATKRQGPDPTFFPAKAVDRLRALDSESLAILLGDVTNRVTRRRVVRSARQLVEMADRAAARSGQQVTFAHALLFGTPDEKASPTLTAQQH